MKKILLILLVLSMFITFAGCSSNDSSDVETSSPLESETVEDSLQEDEDELSAIGDVEVENGILTVSITLPASLVKDATQEDLDNDTSGTYQSAKLNDDGSVTMKLTKTQYKEMLASIFQELDACIKEISESDDYNIDKVEHNDDFSKFDVTLSTDEVGLYDSIASLAFYMYGGMYQIFKGSKSANVVVNYYDTNGALIESSDLNN